MEKHEKPTSRTLWLFQSRKVCRVKSLLTVLPWKVRKNKTNKIEKWKAFSFLRRKIEKKLEETPQKSRKVEKTSRKKNEKFEKPKTFLLFAKSFARKGVKWKSRKLFWLFESFGVFTKSFAIFTLWDDRRKESLARKGPPFCACLRHRNATWILTRAILGENLQEKCGGQNLGAHCVRACAIEMGWTSHRSHLHEKCRTPRTRKTSLRSRNARGHLTRAILCENLH